MADCSLPPPSPFLALPGEPPVPWLRWITAFETYLLAAGLDNVSDGRKRALLLHCLGTEGQRVFDTFGKIPKYDDAVKRLKDHFAAPQSALLRRVIFWRRHQRMGESVSQYVADLKGMASLCKFKTLQDEMIRDQLILHTNCDKIREKLLLEEDDLTLVQAVKIAVQVESALKCAANLSEPAPSQHSSEANESQPLIALANLTTTTTDNVQIASQPRERARQPCGNCGSLTHNSRAQVCPARGKTCSNCGKLNHFHKVCRSAPMRANQQQSLAPTTIIHNVHSGSSFKTCSLMVNGVTLPLLLDTGATVSLLNWSTWKNFFSDKPLAPASTTLRGYGNSNIDLMGTVTLPVRYGDKTLPKFTFHVARHGANLLGLDLFSGLGFTLLDTTGSEIHTVASPWRQQWVMLFDGLGCLSAFAHQPMVDPTVRSVMQPLRRSPLALRDDITAELQRMLEGDIIEQVNASPWISNIVVAKKKDGGLRICVDLRSVNKAIIPDRYPLPTTEELTAQFYGSTVFSKLDLRQGYLQVPLHPDSRNLTAFITHKGVFRFKRMAFGLCSAPSCFQKIMASILAGIPGVAVFLDDIVVHGSTTTEHDERLHRVFSALATHQLTLNGGKCVIGASSIEYVGFRLSAEGISPLLSNTEAIQRVPEPTSPAQVASFLGMTAYYLRFVPQYSETTAPLRRLLKKDEPWLWTPACSEAVQCLKTQLTSPPILAHFDPASPTLVTCDASAIAIGAVMSQVQGGTERPIAFASRALTPTEQRYSVGEREALACLWACERWHLYLYGREFTLRTDHQALTALLATSGTGHRPLRLHRWADRLLQYHYRLQFTPGRDNVVADLLSRAIPTPPTPQVSVPVLEQEEHDIVQLLHTPLQETVSLQELQEASAADPVLSSLSEYIRHGWPKRVPEELTPYFGFRDQLACWNDTCVARGLCAVIPSSLQARVLAMAHEGHLGIVKLKQRCRDTVWWPGIDREIEDMVKDCTACLVSGKTRAPAPPPPMQPLAWPSKPWEHLQLDVCGELHGVPHHQRFLVVLYDLHSKWPEVTPVGSVTARVLINILDSLFARWGLPQKITTDNGPQMVSAELTSYLKEKGIHHIRTAFYHPSANGGVERLNQSLKNGIRAHLAQGCTFSVSLLQTLLHYRATPHATTGVSPASLMLGRELQLPLDRLRPALAQTPAHPLQAKVDAHQSRMKKWFDGKRRARSPNIAVHDWVRIRRPHRDNKLQSFWSPPVQVSKRLGPATFRLADGTRWHASRLRRVQAPIGPSGCAAPTTPILIPRDGPWPGPSTQPDSDTPPVQPGATAPEPTASEPVTAAEGRPAVQPGAAAPDHAAPDHAAPEPDAAAQGRPARARARPGHLNDFETNFHV